MVSLKYYKGVIENANKRPCYFCFKSKKYDNIIWFIPVSTKIKKYQKIYNNKIQKQNIDKILEQLIKMGKNRR